MTLLRIFIICIILVNSGCAHVIKPHIHQWDKSTGKCWICGATFSPMKMKSKQARLKDSKQVMIQAIMIESGMTEPEATILWEKYKQSNIHGLAPYLIQTNPFQKIDRVYIDLVERIKVRTKILKRGR